MWEGGGKSSLHWFAEYGCDAGVRMLLEKGADPNSQNKDGKTLLDVCCTGILSDETHKDEIEALLKAHGGKKGSEL